MSTVGVVIADKALIPVLGVVVHCWVCHDDI
jgi:hypothetical protein